MPYEITWEPQGVYGRYFGNLRGAEILKATETVCSDPRFDDLRFDIADFLDVQGFDVSSSEDHQITAQHGGAAHSNGHFVIAIVTNDERIRSTIRAATVAVGVPTPVSFFGTVAEARDWIGGHPLLAGRPRAHK